MAPGLDDDCGDDDGGDDGAGAGDGGCDGDDGDCGVCGGDGTSCPGRLYSWQRVQMIVMILIM